MTNFIPIFPLNIVVFPGEELNLHIFEPRYKQLISDCKQESKIFGIPTIINGKSPEFGTSIEIISIEKMHDNGNMDIRTRGLEVFRILEIIKKVPDKLYSGAIVNYPENLKDGDQQKMQFILKELKRFHQLLKIHKVYKKPEHELTTYDIAHHIGLSLEQEYELLLLLRENQRQEYIQRHFRTVFPTIEELNQLKTRIALNGHFRKLSIDDDEFI
jgi:Uncharacterized protein, similar to the N-terminal domain of Lon protease